MGLAPEFPQEDAQTSPGSPDLVGREVSLTLEASACRLVRDVLPITKSVKTGALLGLSPLPGLQPDYPFVGLERSALASRLSLSTLLSQLTCK